MNKRTRVFSLIMLVLSAVAFVYSVYRMKTIQVEWLYISFATAAVLAVSLYFLLVSVGWLTHKKTLFFIFVDAFVAFVVFLPTVGWGMGGSYDYISFDKYLTCAHNAIRLFLVDADYVTIAETISVMVERGIEASHLYAYRIISSLSYVISPILTASFIFSLLLQWFYRHSIKFAKGNIYVFSELNDKSLSIAKSLKNAQRIIFTDVYAQRDEDITERIELAKKLGAICLEQDVTGLEFNDKCNLFFFILGENSEEMIRHTLTLSERYKNNSKVRLYLIDSHKLSELAFTGSDSGGIHIRRINDVKLFVYKYLDDFGESLFLGAEDKGEYKQISVVIVGLGRYGTEMMKALSWFCQVNGYRVKIDCFDRDPLAESKLRAVCPELLNEEHMYTGKSAGEYRRGEPQYSIKIHSGIDAFSDTMYEQIAELSDTTEVFVSLGNDLDNVSVASNIRTVFERGKAPFCERGMRKPRINAVVYNKEILENLRSARNHTGQYYDINPIGDLSSRYTVDVLVNGDLQERAFRCDMRYGSSALRNENIYNRYEFERDIPREEFCALTPEEQQVHRRELLCCEYNLTSSMSTAMHDKLAVKMACGFDPVLYESVAGVADDTSFVHRVRDARIEHSRWCVFMWSEGYSAGKPLATGRPAPRNMLAKIHNVLVSYDDISTTNKRLSSAVIGADYDEGEDV